MVQTSVFALFRDPDDDDVESHRIGRHFDGRGEGRVGDSGSQSDGQHRHQVEPLSWPVLMKSLSAEAQMVRSGHLTIRTPSVHILSLFKHPKPHC